MLFRPWDKKPDSMQTEKSCFSFKGEIRWINSIPFYIPGLRQKDSIDVS